jgi:hypothetical protein
MYYVSELSRPALLLLFIYLNGKWVLTRWQCTTIRHITQNNTSLSNKHSTQNYTNNKGHTTHNERHTTHNECNANTITTTTNTITTTIK